jgi:hypothetical protein
MDAEELPTSECGLHRNNAAEWVMWFCLLPLAVAVWTASLFRRPRRRVISA